MTSVANEQLCLDVIEPEAAEIREPESNIVDAVLEYHHGDARAAIAELLADADFFRDQLYVASRLISQGMIRGSWKPRYERL